MKGRAIPYSAAELDWLHENQTMTIREYHRQFVRRFGRQDVTASHLHALRKRKGWKTGRTGQFIKGQEPPNKGQKCAPGTGGRHPNAMATQFKKGERPHTFKGAGHERIDSKDGYVVTVVEETNPWSGAATRPVHKHRLLWEKENGPIPEGMVLKCRDGDKTNCDPSNWDLIPRALLPRLNGGRSGTLPKYDQAEPELKPTILATAKLDHAVRQARKGSQ